MKTAMLIASVAAAFLCSAMSGNQPLAAGPAFPAPIALIVSVAAASAGRAPELDRFAAHPMILAPAPLLQISSSADWAGAPSEVAEFMAKKREIVSRQDIETAHKLVTAAPYRSTPSTRGGDIEPVGRLWSNGGACGEYAWAHYHLLRAIGVSPRRMWVAWIPQAGDWGGSHAVLLVEYGGETLLLDNMQAGVDRFDLIAEKDARYRPEVAGNELGRWRMMFIQNWRRSAL